jgi:hypothetical protein
VSNYRAEIIQGLLLPHSSAAASSSEVVKATAVFSGDRIEQLVFAGRSPWRFLYDVLHGVVVVLDENGSTLEIESVMTLGSPQAWFEAVVVTMRDVLEATLRSKVLGAEDAWMVEVALRELQDTYDAGDLTDGLELALGARDLLIALALPV